MSYSLTQDEQVQLAAISGNLMHGTSPEPELDRITSLVAWFLNVSISAITIIDDESTRTMSLYGVEMLPDIHQTSWFAAALATEDIYCITNALEYPRVLADPLVVGEFGLRFYAAVPLRTKDGTTLGVLSAIDQKPHEISVNEKEFLLRMGALAIDMIESRLNTNQLPMLIALAISEMQSFETPSSNDRPFLDLAERMVKMLDMDYGFIYELGKNGSGSDFIAISHQGQVSRAEAKPLPEGNWPYSLLMQSDHSEVFYPNDVCKRFSDNPHFASLKIESYAGIKLTDSSEGEIGAIVVLDTKPIKNLERVRVLMAILGIFVASKLKCRRAAADSENQVKVPTNRLPTSFNQSIINKSMQQQQAWLSKKIIGDSPVMHKVREHLRLAIIKQVNTVLLIGETGTGKGECSMAIHDGSGAHGTFIEINCGALPRDLVESELFGHEKGAFTGAIYRKIGLFEQAHGGTIFLDEIAELPPDLQVKLLSVLQRRKLRRIGGTNDISIEVRVVAATNRPLPVALQDGSLRHDLFFRIAPWRIELPPLRERSSDVILFARHFLAKRNQLLNHQIDGLTHEAELLLKQYDWPGNVRQLINLIERAVILENGRNISAETISHALEEEKKLFTPSLNTCQVPDMIPPIDIKVRRLRHTDAESKAILDTLVHNHYNKTHAAKELGLTRGQLEYRLKLIDKDLLAVSRGKENEDGVSKAYINGRAKRKSL